MKGKCQRGSMGGNSRSMAVEGGLWTGLREDWSRDCRFRGRTKVSMRGRGAWRVGGHNLWREKTGCVCVKCLGEVRRETRGV